MNYSSNIENYKIHEFLGKGTFGEVYKSTYRGEQYAIKILGDRSDKKL